MAVTYAELVARFTADTSGLVKGFAQVNGSLTTTQQRLGNFAKSADALGKKMTMSLTLPLALIGAAAVKMAMDFEVSMAKAVGLAGLAENAVEHVSDAILELATKTGQAPVALADAFYYLSSAGLSTTEAMGALENAAMASTAGLGEAAVIADVLSSAMNAYRKEGLSAYDATNALVGAVKYGKGEAQDFAGALGRVIPLSAQMGVSFQETTAAVAGMTQMGLDAYESVTAMRGIMLQLISPSQAAEQALAKVGLSTEMLRKQIRDEGLITTLQALDAAFKGDEAAIAAVFPEVRGLIGMLNLTGQNAEAVEKIVRNLSSETDFLGAAFDKMATTDAFAMKQAMSELQVALIGLGQTLLPIVVKVVQFGKSLAEAFANMSPLGQTAIVTFGIMLAVIGPVILIAAKLVQAFMLVRSAILWIKATSLATAFTNVITPVTAVIAVVGALVYAVQAVGRANAEAKERVEEMTKAMEGNTAAMKENVNALIVTKATSGGLADNLNKVDLSFKDLTKGITGTNREYLNLINILRGAGLSFDDWGMIHETREAFTGGAKDVLELAVATDTLTKKQKDLLISSHSTKQGGTDWLAVLTSMKAQFPATAGEVDAFTASQDAAATAAEEMKLAADPLAETLDAAADAAERLNNEFDSLFGASMSLVEAEIGVRTAQAEVVEELLSGDKTLDSVTTKTMNATKAFQELRVQQERSGVAASDAKNNFALQAGGLVLLMEKTGATQEMVNAYIRTLESGFTDAEYNAIIGLTGGEQVNLLVATLANSLERAREDGPVETEVSINVHAAGDAAVVAYWKALVAGTPLPVLAPEVEQKVDLFGGWGSAFGGGKTKLPEINTSPWGVWNREAATAIEVMQGADIAAAALGGTWLETGGMMVEASIASNMQTGELYKTMLQAGLTDEQLGWYLTTLGLTPDQISTIVAAPNAEAVVLLVTNLNAALVTARQGAVIPIDANVEKARKKVRDFMAETGFTLTGKIQPPGAAHGGVFFGAQTRLIAEAGPEAVVPLGKSSIATADRMRVLAQAGLLATDGGSSVSSAALSANTSTSNSNTYQINVSVAPGGDPAEVGRTTVAAIRAYERRSGTLWRN